jgi:hypothetical protein
VLHARNVRTREPRCGRRRSRPLPARAAFAPSLTVTRLPRAPSEITGAIATQTGRYWMRHEVLAAPHPSLARTREAGRVAHCGVCDRVQRRRPSGGFVAAVTSRASMPRRGAGRDLLRRKRSRRFVVDCTVASSPARTTNQSARRGESSPRGASGCCGAVGRRFGTRGPQRNGHAAGRCGCAGRTASDGASADAQREQSSSSDWRAGCVVSCIDHGGRSQSRNKEPAGKARSSPAAPRPPTLG